ncbi:MAG: DUF4358 domain-containing protein [Candidatus Faecivivens sp.]|nr:DUF4358 domain-containing protein [Oscillospiraceae bacterium]MDY2711868.1 DUF4358 domain-containing protein [Candidatus Faecivivens sp.]
MKRFLSVLLILTLFGIITLFSCCNSRLDTTAGEVYNAVQSAFLEKYGSEAILNAPTDIDDTVLSEQFHLSSSDVEDYRGVTAGMMTNCDALLVVKARSGKLEAVRDALSQALEEQRAQFSWYAVMDNPERLEAAKVVTEKDFAALLIVGISPDDPDLPVDFTEDVEMAEKAFRNAVRA